MANTNSIDLHPEKMRGTGPETALLAARHFIEAALRRGHREIRIITGLGIHGDGTPRLRSRVEKEVLAAFYSSIESQTYEQGGAVIRVSFKSGQARPDRTYQKKHASEVAHKAFVMKEERLMVAFERLESAEGYWEEGDLRRCRLKLNQISREFFPETGAVKADGESIKLALAAFKKKIDALA